MKKVFVYGTLKKGHGNHYLLQGAAYEGQFYVDVRYTMLDLKGFPGLIPSENRNTIVGEVYSINDEHEKLLDALEGVPHLYQKEYITVGEHEDVLVYVLNTDTVHNINNFAPIPDGCW